MNYNLKCSITALCIGLGCDLPPLKGEITIFGDGSSTITWSDGTASERSADGSLSVLTDKSGSKHSFRNKCYCEDPNPMKIK
jgi:hypothetical protein